jgi:OOP family OmpA-OmpF porin
MKTYPETTAVIEGHTDNVGREESNLRLSTMRAESVRTYLIENFGIAANRLTARGYGSARPVADNATPEGR